MDFGERIGGQEEIFKKEPQFLFIRTPDLADPNRES